MPQLHPPLSSTNPQEDRQRLRHLLNAFRKRAGLTRHKLAVIAGISPEYVWRLCEGEREHPSVPVLFSPANAMKISTPELTELLKAAGHNRVCERKREV